MTIDRSPEVVLSKTDHPEVVDPALREWQMALISIGARSTCAQIMEQHDEQKSEK